MTVMGLFSGRGLNPFAPEHSVASGAVFVNLVPTTSYAQTSLPSGASEIFSAKAPAAPAQTSDEGADGKGLGFFEEARELSPLSAQYPDAARRQGLEGQVTLEAIIGPEGLVREVSVLKGSGHLLLDQAAHNALLRTRFEPARRAGQPIESRKRLLFRFQLDPTA